jgi:YVTN family beta-propeller protein
VAITPDGAFAYVTNHFSATVSVIETASNIVVATVAVGALAPRGVAITPDGAFVYVANFGSNTVSVIETASNTVVATVNVGINPLGVAITPDGAFAYATNANAGTVSVIETAGNTVVATVGVADGPVAVAITPAAFGEPLPHDFLFLAEDQVFIDELDASEGDIHSNNKVLFGRADEGDPSTHTGNLSAVNDIEIRRNNTIVGNATAGANVVLKDNATVTGTITEKVRVDAVPLPVLSYTAGGDDIRVTSGESLTLAPGSYGDVFVRKGVLSLSSGEYFMVTLEQGTRAKLDVDVTNGPVTINVVDELIFGNSEVVTIRPSGESGTTELTFNLLGSNRVPLPTDARVLGTIIAPNAKVRVRQHVAFKGAICAKNITMDEDATVLHHSSTMPLPMAPLLLAGPGENTQGTELPTVYDLSQNYPNPFNPSTVIEYALPKEARVKLEVYNILGQRVATLVDETKSAGYYAERFDASGLASGVYVYRIQADIVETKKLLLLR